MPFLGHIPDDLHNQARYFLSQSWSIIPLRGDSDPNHPKAPGLSRWRAFQSRMPSEDEVSRWFGRSNLSGKSHLARNSRNCAIGIVLGKVSGLAVLDIDDPDRARDFAQQFIHLTCTFTVVSGNRGLPHYYFRVPADMRIPARSRNGVELRSDGQYVVAPGSVIGGRRWLVVSDIEPLTLSESDLSAVLEFVHPKPSESAVKRRNRASGAESTPFNVDLPLSSVEDHESETDWLARYRWQAERLGRNNALFDTACLARDSGLPFEQVQRILVMAHVEQSPRPGQLKETPSQRMQEALATIRSVYSRPARKRHAGTRQLPNSLREALLACNQVNTARLLDALLMLDVEAGTTIRPAEIYESVAGFGIGKNVVYGSLKMLAELPVSSENPPHTPPSIYAYAASNNSLLTNPCRVVRVANPGKKRGRPAKRYVMPSIEMLCDLYGVVDNGSDWLTVDELKSPAAYRAGLHAAMIRRSPGQYSRDWLAQRLGVSRDSCRRYERRRGVYSEAFYTSVQVSKETVDQLLPDQPEPGKFLEDDRGKRYPPLPALAKMLLAYGRRVVFRVQRANHYSVLPPLNTRRRTGSVSRVARGCAESQPIKAPWSGKRRSIGRQVVVDGDVREPGRTDTRFVHTVADSQAKVPRKGEKCCGPQQLGFDVAPISQDQIFEDSASVDHVARQVYDRLRSLNPARSVTRSYARILVKTYGSSLIVRGLELLTSRQDVRNPAGYLLAFLRSESGKYGASPVTTDQPESEKSKEHYGPKQSMGDAGTIIYSGISALEAQHQQWLEKLRNSQFAEVYASALEPV